ncbi:hypothetical protein [Clostridium botulinum]|uniref:hypothetical protein n=1 Tax=Clostridium botulinum TaxID=1491 RepID=UPI00249E39DE|nr:hypothetical protein [Clostridium botulinum]MDU4596466.1 hypothetical protein [Clostridium sporogenes]WGZ44767.1 hypothetical protein HEQ52_18310 [Clostridium botulinum]
MPFHKVDPEEEIRKAIKKNPELAKEYQELKARKENSNKKEITSKEAENIIDSRKPLGKFWLKENEFYIGIDNETGDAWTEEFKDKSSCIEWLIGKESE